MEKKINIITELIKEGQIVLIKNQFMGDKDGDDVAVYSGKIKTYKYPIGDKDGRKCRSLGRNDKGVIEFKYDEEGSTGEEMIYDYSLLGKNGGSYNFDEFDDISSWDIRIIDENHPKYDKNLSKSGKQFDQMLNIFGKMFGES
jgi:hypothetical protein